jgi:hypothetical protein
MLLQPIRNTTVTNWQRAIMIKNGLSRRESIGRKGAAAFLALLYCEISLSRNLRLKSHFIYLSVRLLEFC